MYKLFFGIFIIIQNKELLKKSSSIELDKLINKEWLKIINQVFEMLYAQSSLANLNNEKVEKLLQWAKKMGGRKIQRSKD